MTLKEELKQLYGNSKKDAKQLYGKAKQHPLIYLIFTIAVLILMSLLMVLPYFQVNYHNINNATEEATLENQYRATLAQILGGIAVGIGIYFAWGNLTTAREGQITERFTRAIEQLGNKELEIRLGGIYALERIANESENDYWPIMDILTSYVRNNSSLESIESEKATHISTDIQSEESNKTRNQNVKKLSLDVQAILTVIGRRKHYFGAGESKRLNLAETCLQGAHLSEYHLERANLYKANLTNAKFVRTHLKQTVFIKAHLENASLWGAHLENTVLIEAHLENADLSRARLEDALLIKAHLENANFYAAHLENADFDGACLEGAKFESADLTGAQRLSIDQLSKVKTLYDAELDEELEMPLRDKYPALFEEPKC